MEFKKSAAYAHYLYSSKVINDPKTILDQIHAGMYEHSLIELLYWISIQRARFDWSHIENIRKYIELKKEPFYTGITEFEKFITALSTTDFEISEIYKTCFIQAYKNPRREAEVAYYETHHQQAEEDCLRNWEQIPTTECYLLYYFAITQQLHPEIVYIIAGRLEGCGQATLATRLWDLPTLKNAYPHHRYYAIIRLAESSFSAVRCMLEFCVEDKEFYKTYWPDMPVIIDRMIEDKNVTMHTEKEYRLRNAARTTNDKITQVKTILRCVYPTTDRNPDTIGAGFLTALELNHPESSYNPGATLNQCGTRKLKNEYTYRVEDLKDFFRSKTGQEHSDRARQCCTQVYSHDFRLMLLKLEEHVPQLQYHHPEICQLIGTMAMEANHLRIANEYFAFASTRLNISDSHFKLAKIAEDQRSRGLTDLRDNEIEQIYELALDGGNYAAAIRLAERYKEKMSPRDENRSKKIYEVLFRGFDAAYNMKDSIGCEAVLQSINVFRENPQIQPTEEQKLEIATFVKLHQSLLHDQSLFHDVLKQHRNETGGFFKIGDLARSRRGNYTRLLASADGTPPHPFANSCMLFIYPESDKAKRLGCIANDSSFDTMLNYYLWWFRKKFQENLTPRSFTEIANDVILRHFEHIISTQTYNSEKQLQAKLFLALMRLDGMTLTDCYHQSPTVFYLVRHAIGKWDRQSDEQDQLLAEVEKKCTAEMDANVLLLLSFMEASLALDTNKAKELSSKVQLLIAKFTLLDEATQRSEAHKRLWAYASNYNLLAIAYFIHLRGTPQDKFVAFLDLMKKSLTWAKLEHYYSKHDVALYMINGKNLCASLFESIKNLGIATTETQSNYFNFARIMLYVITKNKARLKSIYRKDYRLTHTTLLKLLQIESLIGNPNSDFINRIVNKFKQKRQSAIQDFPETQSPQEMKQLTSLHRRPSTQNNLDTLEELEVIAERPNAVSSQLSTPNHLKKVPTPLQDRSAALQTPRPRSLSANMSSSSPSTPQSKDDTAGMFTSGRRRKTSPPLPSPSPSGSTDNDDTEDSELNYSFSVPSGSSSQSIIPKPLKF